MKNAQKCKQSRLLIQVTTTQKNIKQCPKGTLIEKGHFGLASELKVGHLTGSYWEFEL